MTGCGHNHEYLLGDGDAELERLKFQQRIWGPVTRKFFDRLGVSAGWKCLDVGAGPGLVSLDLHEIVGEGGEVIALEPSGYYRNVFQKEIESTNPRNIKIVAGTPNDATLSKGHYDLIFVRWVISFVPDPEVFLLPLIDALKAGGIIAIQDYVHEGCSLFPTGGPWDKMPEAIRAWWRSGGGDPFVAAKLPALFRRLGVSLIDYTPTSLAGGPDSLVMEWMGRFLRSQIPVMVARGILLASEAAAMQEDWQAHLQFPDTVFFSPFVVDVAGRR